MVDFDVIDASHITNQLNERGYVHVRGSLDLRVYLALCSELGHVVAEETISLREGAHAYVAKPEPVPFHTDQAQVEVVGWFCEQQDAIDGANLLLDSRPILKSMAASLRERLQHVRLSCPPVAGGPPSSSFAILRRTGTRDAFFCSPWLDSECADERAREALDCLRSAIRKASVDSVIRIRLGSGEALFVDNQRVMHGRDRLTARSKRKLRRAWIITRETAALE